MYLIRPSHEEFRCDGFSFKVGYKAVVQAPEGQNEQTVQASKDAKVKTAAKAKASKLTTT